MANLFRQAAGGNWNAANSWSLTSGGAGDRIPSAGDCCFMNNKTCLLNVDSPELIGLYSGTAISNSGTGYITVSSGVTLHSDIIQAGSSGALVRCSSTANLTVVAATSITGGSASAAYALSCAGTGVVVVNAGNVTGGSNVNAPAINNGSTGVVKLTCSLCSCAGSSFAVRNLSAGSVVITGAVGGDAGGYTAVVNSSTGGVSIVGNVQGGTASGIAGILNSNLGTITIIGDTTVGSGGETAHAVYNVMTGAIFHQGTVNAGSWNSTAYRVPAIIAKQDGDWSDTNTWGGSAVPVAGDKVHLSVFAVLGDLPVMPASATPLNLLTGEGFKGQLWLDITGSNKTLYVSNIVGGSNSYGCVLISSTSGSNTALIETNDGQAGLGSAGAAICCNHVSGSFVIINGTVNPGSFSSPVIKNINSGTVTINGSAILGGTGIGATGVSNSSTGAVHIYAAVIGGSTIVTPAIQNGGSGGIFIYNNSITGGTMFQAIDNLSTGVITCTDCTLIAGSGANSYTIYSLSSSPVLVNCNLIHSKFFQVINGMPPQLSSGYNNYEQFTLADNSVVTYAKLLPVAQVLKGVAHGDRTGTLSPESPFRRLSGIA